MWMIPVALVCGNTFILKPSEKVPLSAVRIGELLIDAGLPAGVFNIVHGDRECVDVLLNHPLVAAVSFVGSTATAKYIYETGTRNGKRVQAAGGAKNHLIIMPDADLDQSIKALAASAYGCAGQRCMAGSVAVSIGSIADPLVEGLCDYAGSLSVGPTDGENDVDMGPLIRLRVFHWTVGARSTVTVFCLGHVLWITPSQRCGWSVMKSSGRFFL
jgi:malonate-semialdehyde dehydrogenase (acetylating)/methylmalonate-semialdehyde dehydrogenase